jgi:O-antigen/teichoic acid export membrane protein
MSTVQRIARNTSLLLISQIIGYVLSLFSVAYIARYLGAAGYGIISFAFAFTTLFSVLADLGLQYLVVREVARDKSLAPKYLANVNLMKIVLSFITFGLIALTINLMGYPQQTIYIVYIIGLSVVCGSLASTFYSIFQAYEKMEYQSLGQVLSAALMFVGVILAVKYHISIIGFSSLYVLAGVVSLIYAIGIFRWKFSSSPSWSRQKIAMDWGFWKMTIKEALPFGLSSIFVTIFYWISSVMLSSMKGDVDVGWYNAAFRMVLVLLYIPTALNIVIYPLMSRFHLSSQDALRLSYEKYFKYMLILAVPIGVGTTLLAHRIIVLIFGSQYSPSAIALQILVWAAASIFLGAAFYQLLQSTNNQRKGTIAAAMCMVINIALNLLLIPGYGYKGAAIATLATEGFSLAAGVWFCSRIGYPMPKRLISTAIKVAVASSIMAAFIIFSSALTLPLLIVVSVLIYFLLLLVMGGIDKEDRNLVKAVLSSKEKGLP